MAAWPAAADEERERERETHTDMESITGLLKLAQVKGILTVGNQVQGIIL